MSRWNEFIAGSVDRGHAHGVQVYRELDELAASVADFLAAGFALGEPALIVARAANLHAFEQRLVEKGCEPSSLERNGLLTALDAEATLAAIMPEGHPSSGAFELTVGGAVDEIAERFPERRLRAFGEMVDILCERGDADAADSLEELWNSLAMTRDFSLLCGYHLDVFDRAAQTGALRDLCRTHSHVLPAADTARLNHAVDAALDEVLGPAEAGRVYVLIGEELRQGRVPGSQLILLWLSENMPSLADRVLSIARARYDSALPA